MIAEQLPSYEAAISGKDAVLPTTKTTFINNKQISNRPAMKHIDVWSEFSDEKLRHAFPEGTSFPESWRAFGLSEKIWEAFVADLNSATALNGGEKFAIVAANCTWAAGWPVGLICPSMTNRRIYNRKQMAVHALLDQYNAEYFNSRGFRISIEDAAALNLTARSKRRYTKDGKPKHFSPCAPYGDYCIRLSRL